MSEPVRRVAVTGASGYVGAGLVQRLQQTAQIEGVLAIDTRPPAGAPGPKVDHLVHDVAVPFGRSFSEYGVQAVVHLAYVLRPGRDRVAARRVNVSGTENVLAACADAGVRSVVYLSSTTVYGAHPDNPPLLTEDAPVRPVEGYQYSEDKVEAERRLQEFARQRPDVSVAILRGCPVLGPHANNFVSRALLRSFLVAARGCDPPMQFVHEDDLTDLVTLCTLQALRGLYNVAGQGTIRWSEVAGILGRRLVTAPAPLLYWATEVAWRLRLQSDSPSCGLDLIRYRWTASTDVIERELGFAFRHSSREAVEGFAGDLTPGPSPRAERGGRAGERPS